MYHGSTSFYKKMSQYAAMIPFSVVGTEFENIFNAEDGSSSRSDWYEAMKMLLDRGVKPKYNEVSDRAIATAYLDVSEQRLSINIFNVQVALAAGIDNKKDMLALFEGADDWFNGADFCEALGLAIGVHCTQLLTLQRILGRDDRALSITFTYWGSCIDHVFEKFEFMDKEGLLERYLSIFAAELSEDERQQMVSIHRERRNRAETTANALGCVSVLKCLGLCVTKLS